MTGHQENSMNNEPINLQPNISGKPRGGKLVILGEPMKRGSLLCQRCVTVRHSRSCPTCGYDAVYIRIMWKGKFYNFWHDRSDRSYSFAEGSKVLHTINQQIEARQFNPKDYLTSTIQEMRFEVSFKKWLDLKKKEVESNELSPETLRAYRSYFKNHFQGLIGKDLREIELGDLTGILDACSSHLSLNFKRRLIQCLHSFFGWQIRWGKLKAWPVFPEIKGDDAQIKRAIPFQQQMDGIANIPEEHRDIFLFMRETGVRIGEACAVQVQDLDLKMGRILIQRTWSGSKLTETTKQKKKQFIPLSDLAQSVASKNKRGKLPGVFLFINPVTNRGYRDEFLRRLWKEHSGIEITLYEAMRHSTITDWASHGSAYDVQRGARHTDMRTTMKYVHAADSRLVKMFNRAEAVSIVRQVSDSEN